jgi:hypothetical protein
MDFLTFLWTTFGAFVTLATFSFLYKDNPFYKFAEHLVVGVSAGYFVIILWHNALVTNLFQRLADGDWYVLWLNSERWWYIIPAVLGVMMWTRFSKKYGWVSRWPMALYIGIATGIAIPLEMANRVVRQLHATMAPIDWSSFVGHGGFNLLDATSGLSQMIVFVGAISGLVYFFFSKAHTGVFGAIAKFGIWVLMIGFGASFGFTVMARISLFIQRVQYLDLNWVRNGLNTGTAPNPQYSGWFAVVFYAMVALIVGYVVYEIVLHLKKRGEKPGLGL